MENLTIVNHSKSKAMIEKFTSSLVKITSYGSQLASWGKMEKSGIFINYTNKKNNHTIELLEEYELNNFSSNGYQYQWFLIDNGEEKLLVKHDEDDINLDDVKRICNIS